MWLVLLESAKDWFLGVDPPEQPVSPRVWYGTTCLLTTDVVGSVPCSEVAWERVLCLTCELQGARGTCVGNLSTARGAGVEKLSKVEHATCSNLL
jgi:hypothetical protein